MTEVLADGVTYQVVWTGARWRDFPPPPLGQLKQADLPAVRAFLRDHYSPTKWYLSKELAERFEGTVSAINVILWDLQRSGEVESRWVRRWVSGRGSERRLYYRWVPAGQRSEAA